MTRIFIRTRFEGFHHWPDAPQEVAFLRDLHRHEFHVRVWTQVDHEDRAIEFILFKRIVDRTIQSLQSTRDTKTWSCEMWAREIGALSAAEAVEVSEDGENGAVWSATL